MSDFVNELITMPTTFGTGVRWLNPLTIGPWALSIQASKYHYCSPRETLPLRQYTEWECALWESETNKWLNPKRNPNVFEGLAAAERWEDGFMYTVGAYIDTADVQALVDRLRQLAEEEETS